MMLSEKILRLRKQRGLSQEELAEKLKVSRQAVSRWEGGSALPDAMNLLQLSKLFEVSADYLLNDELDEAATRPQAQEEGKRVKKKSLQQKKWLGFGIASIGLWGQAVIYLLSRVIEVPVPYIWYTEAGQKMYRWSNTQTDHSYWYFIREYDLELLCGVLVVLILAGIGVALVPKEWAKRTAAQLWK